ncbi:uncharacterized protein BKA78DRAFT_188605 [Phyllosticta capitalensis]|uniref:uncharacterized protein n=1 Tax=Phyllosticta capitalensis TaxID=121624 RepID=UPI00312ED27E
MTLQQRDGSNSAAHRIHSLKVIDYPHYCFRGASESPRRDKTRRRASASRTCPICRRRSPSSPAYEAAVRSQPAANTCLRIFVPFNLPRPVYRAGGARVANQTRAYAADAPVPTGPSESGGREERPRVERALRVLQQGKKRAPMPPRLLLCSRNNHAGRTCPLLLPTTGQEGRQRISMKRPTPCVPGACDE